MRLDMNIVHDDEAATSEAVNALAKHAPRDLLAHPDLPLVLLAHPWARRAVLVAQAWAAWDDLRGWMQRHSDGGRKIVVLAWAERAVALRPTPIAEAAHLRRLRQIVRDGGPRLMHQSKVYTAMFNRIFNSPASRTGVESRSERAVREAVHPDEGEFRHDKTWSCINIFLAGISTGEVPIDLEAEIDGYAALRASAERALRCEEPWP